MAKAVPFLAGTIRALPRIPTLLVLRRLSNGPTSIGPGIWTPPRWLLHSRSSLQRWQGAVRDFMPGKCRGDPRTDSPCACSRNMEYTLR